MTTTGRSGRHRHWFTSLWCHFGPFGPQDQHLHPCAKPTCEAVIVGEGRDCGGPTTPHRLVEPPRPEGTRAIAGARVRS